jgi:hypothetical protein
MTVSDQEIISRSCAQSMTPPSDRFPQLAPFTWSTVERYLTSRQRRFAPLPSHRRMLASGSAATPFVGPGDTRAALAPSIGRLRGPVPNQVPTTPVFTGPSATAPDTRSSLTC